MTSSSQRAHRRCGPALALVLAFAAAGVAAQAADRASSALVRIPAALPGAPALPVEMRARLAAALESRGDGYQPRTRNLRPDGGPRFTNRLLLESSPYLQQHAHNPVNWYPWGDEAFAAARALGRPVLVSIGYSTCHWCHVMEEESFDDPAVAEVLNRYFVAIKVDREARPDVDSVYMAAVRAMRQRGGWPLNVWVTPDREPFFGGTYFPPADARGRPGFVRVLETLHEQYTRDPERIASLASQVAEAVRQQHVGLSANASAALDAEILTAARTAALSTYDPAWGGRRGAPKFPSSYPLRFLLREHRRTGNDEALASVVHTLEKMAAGGMYDRVGGGFHRYSTDARWLVPHFEKMLYDNALLALVYLEAWQVTGRDDFARVTREVLDYVAREMTSPEGAFYSATDADSATPEGELEEGAFFTWSAAEIEAALSPEDSAAVTSWFGVTPEGNFDGRNVLQAARADGDADEALRRRLARARERLYSIRAERPAPLRDDKVIAAWNGLMITAFARAGFAFDDTGYRARAARAADFVLTRMRPEGRLHRVHREGRADGPAFLDDYAFVIQGLLDLYEADADVRWLREGLALQTRLDANYADEIGGGYFASAADDEVVLAREKPMRDGAVPSGNSVAALNLLRLAELTSDDAQRERAALLFSAFHPVLTTNPMSVGDLLVAVDYLLEPTKEIVVVRPSDVDTAAELLAPLRRSFVPNRIVSRVTEGDELEATRSLVPLVEGKTAQRGETTAYVCLHSLCLLPTSDPKEFARQIGKVETGAD